MMDGWLDEYLGSPKHNTVEKHGQSTSCIPLTGLARCSFHGNHWSTTQMWDAWHLWPLYADDNPLNLSGQFLHWLKPLYAKLFVSQAL